MSAPTPTYGDAVALYINHPSMSWMKHDLPEIVKMADLQADETVLVLACETGELILEIVRVSGGNHGRMVGVEDSRFAVQTAVMKLDDLNLMTNKRLVSGDPYHLDTIDVLKQETEGCQDTTFDVVFARNALPANSSQHISILQHWATFLTPTSGRMIVTFTPCDNDEPYLAGIQAVGGDGEVIARMSWMLEREWAQLDARFRALAVEAGLVLESMKRLVFQGAGTVEMGEQMDEMAQEKGCEIKQDWLWAVLDQMAPELKNMCLAGLPGVVGEARRLQLEATLNMVPVTAKLAAVLRLG